MSQSQLVVYILHEEDDIDAQKTTLNQYSNTDRLHSQWLFDKSLHISMASSVTYS